MYLLLIGFSELYNLLIRLYLYYCQLSMCFLNSQNKVFGQNFAKNQYLISVLIVLSFLRYFKALLQCFLLSVQQIFFVSSPCMPILGVFKKRDEFFVSQIFNQIDLSRITLQNFSVEVDLSLVDRISTVLNPQPLCTHSTSRPVSIL